MNETKTLGLLLLDNLICAIIGFVIAILIFGYHIQPPIVATSTFACPYGVQGNSGEGLAVSPLATCNPAPTSTPAVQMENRKMWIKGGEVNITPAMWKWMESGNALGWNFYDDTIDITSTPLTP